MQMRAIYFDGKTAVGTEVELAAGAGELRLTDAVSAAPVARFPISSLRRDHAASSETAITGPRRERIVLSSPDAEAWLRANCGSCRRSHLLPGRWSWPKLFAVGTAGFALVIALFWNFPRLAGPFVAFIPFEVDRAMGDAVFKSLAPKFGGVCRNARGQAALQRLVDRLVAIQGHQHPVHASILRSGKLNAFATPGTHFVVLNGLIQGSASSEEFAGVVGHELAHLFERHPVRGMVGKIGILGFALYLSGGETDSLAALGLRLGTEFASLSYSRANESDADQISVNLLNKAGIDSRGLRNFFLRLKAAKGEPVQDWLEFTVDHPLHENRAEALAEIERAGDAAMTSAEWAALKSACS